MTKIQIKNLFGRVLFKHEKEDNTIKDALIEAVKSCADLRGADLRGADLRGADLGRAKLSCAKLPGADLHGANLSGADLDDTKGITDIPLACPSDGAFIGWKKVSCCLIQLLIPENAKRCSATTQKCRCEFAKVMSITRIGDGKELQSVENTSYTPSITYKVGEMIYPDSFDENRWNECSHGIHFFINKQDAIKY